jgi:RNA polymerase sigma factor (sigma-70 family)
VVDDPAAASGLLDRSVLVQSLSELPTVDREALVLFHLGDMPLEQIASVVNAPVGTVKSSLSRARRALRDRLLEKGYQR